VTDYALYMLNLDGYVTSWNAGGKKIKGYAPDEIIGEHFSRFYTPEDQAAGRPQRALQIVRDMGRYEEEAWRVRKDGSFFWASVVMDAVTDDDGHLLGFAKITRDITERREAQIKLEKMRQQLAESQKMDALGQLTGGVAHDFNNLLMIVTGHLQTVKKAMSGDPKIRRAVQAIELASQRGASLTRQLLTFSRRQRVKPEAIDVGQRIAAVRDVLASGLGSGVDLLIDTAPDTWPIKVDTAEFEIALVNLAINARDAMTKGGLITIEARNERLDELSYEGEYVSVTVKDTGAGIPEDVLGKIFDPFFTTKPVGKGTGLGLSQVHGFVHQAGGTLKVSSTLGKGTAVIMYFPRALSDKETSFQAARTSSTPGEREAVRYGTVLLVEDNPEVASASTELLEQLGYHVLWAPDAPSALEEIAKDGISLIISDIVMPGPMDGLQLAETIKQSHPELPILLTTGYSREAQDVTTFPILRKPYQIHELSRALASLNGETM
jgi:PAS domain S-box-containing protein